MLKSVKITNFQKQRDLELELVPGVNVLAGRSDLGKSAVVRAVGWALRNRPQGFGFRYDPEIARDGGKKLKKDDLTSVNLSFDNGEISRQRNEKSINSYIVNGEMLEALRGDVPEEVSGLINIESCCFQDQHDPYFLLQDTPGEVARKLNEVSGLDLISRVIKTINSMAAKAEAEAAMARKTAGEKDGRIQELVFLDKVIPLAEKIQAALDERDKLSAQEKELNEIIGSLEEIDSDLAETSGWLGIEEPFLRVWAGLDRLYRAKEELSDLDDLITRATDVEESLENERAWLAIEDAANKVAGILERKKGVEREWGELESVIRRFDDNEDMLEPKRFELEGLRRAYAALLLEAGICPWCGSEVERAGLEEHVL